MDRKEKPYLPLYVQDFMTDEKLRECSAESAGVYIFILCLLHKQTDYGTILLKQKDKQNEQQILNFATKFALHLPFDVATITRGLRELLEYDVLQIEGDLLSQKRMVRDCKLSTLRAKVGSIGGKKTAKTFALAKPAANADIDNDIEIDNDIVNNNRGGFKKPTLGEVEGYMSLLGFHPESEKFFDYYSSNGWKVGKNPMKDWKAACRNWTKNKPKYGSDTKERKFGRLPIAGIEAFIKGGSKPGE